MTLPRFLLSPLLLLALLMLPLSQATAQNDLPPNCIDVGKDGGFEAQDVWQFAETSAPGFFDANIFHSGNHSAFVGIPQKEEVENLEVDTTVWQEMQLPAAETITLAAWLRSQAGDENDKRYVVIWDLETDESTVLLYEAALEQDWQETTLDLTPFAGKNILLVFGVHNDGTGEKAGLWVDDVQVIACGGEVVSPPTATSSPTPIPSPTPAPTATNTPIPTATVTTAMPEPLTSPTPTPSPTLLATATPMATTTSTPTITSTGKRPPLPTPIPPQRPKRGLPDNSALPLLAGILLSSLIAIVVITLNLRR
jgi:hypothetical protein